MKLSLFTDVKLMSERGFMRKKILWTSCALALVSLCPSLALAQEAVAPKASQAAVLMPTVAAPDQSAGQLPSGGQVVAGNANIAATSAHNLVVSQSSDKAIINWDNFSIGTNNLVQFNNGQGATLNRVTSGYVSALDGALKATGSVYLINPNGVIVGKNGTVEVGGAFLAGTRDISNANFLSGGDLVFEGNSTATVVNLGKIGALGGDVVLMAQTVRNEGAIASPNGTTGLLAGRQILLKDQSVDGGRFTVVQSSTDSSVTQSGLIEAANAELRAEGGNIYALAGNTQSLVRATEVTNQGGKIYLTAANITVADTAMFDASASTAGNGGEVMVIASDALDFHGKALAKGGSQSGNGGFIETSGAEINISDAKIDTGAPKGDAGTWLLDPIDLTIDAAAADTISNNLATSNVTVKTTATTTSPLGNATSGVGDININAAITWSSANKLTLEAYHGINILAPITVTGAGKVKLLTNTGYTGGDYGFGLSDSGFAGSISFTGTPKTGQSLAINGTPYTLLYSMTDLLGDKDGYFALAKPINASGKNYNSAIIGNFSGNFTGLGNTVSNLTIKNANGNIGLFGQLGDHTSYYENFGTVTIRDLGLVGGSIQGSGSSGGIAGASLNAQVSFLNVYSTNKVVGANTAGGIIGASTEGGLHLYQNSLNLTNTFSTGAISGASYVGGLVGQAQDVEVTIRKSHTAGTITSGSSIAGGLVGNNQTLYYDGSFSNTLNVTDSYTTGDVTGASGAGGLVGSNDSLGFSLDTVFSSGRISSANGAAGGLIAFSLESYWGGNSTVSNASSRGDVSGYYNTGGLIGSVSISAGLTIKNAYASGNITVGSNTGGLLGMTGVEGGLTIQDSYTSGIITGQNKVGGLVGYLSSSSVPSDTLQNVTTSGAVTGRDHVGGLVGYSDNVTQITNALSTGQIFGRDQVGGLIGHAHYDTQISNTLSSGQILGRDQVGGLVGSNYRYLSITHSKPTSAVTGQNEVGGLVGYSQSGITLSFLDLDVEITGNNFVGGLIGHNEYDATNMNDIVIRNNVSGNDYVGGLIGSSYGNETISNSSVLGNVSGHNQVGGLIGESVFNSSNMETITDSFVSGKVSGHTNVGGFVGLSDHLTIKDSYSQLIVTGVTNTGGFVGALNVYLSVTNSRVHGSVIGQTNTGGVLGKASIDINYGGYFDIVGTAVTATVTGGDYTGGLVGKGGYGGTISSSNVTSKVTGNNYTGGLVGGESDQYASILYVADSVTSADVEGLQYTGGLVGHWTHDQGGGVLTLSVAGSHASGNISGTSDVGGLVGNAGEVSILNSYSEGDIVGTSNVGGLMGSGGENTSNLIINIADSYSTGSVTGTVNVGGLLGFVGSVSDINGSSDLTIARSFTLGTIGGTSHLGGLVGAGSENAGVSTIAISDSYSGSAVIGTHTLGGLMGSTGRGTSYLNLSIKDSYARGFVSGDKSAEGGLIGYYGAYSADDYIVMENVYWDKQTSGQAHGALFPAEKHVGGQVVPVILERGKGLTTAQLQSKLPNGFLSTVWGTENGLYPYLKWQFPNGAPTSHQKISGFTFNADGTSAIGAKVGLYTYAQKLGSTYSGANGYYYYVVPMGNVSSTTKLGGTLTLSGSNIISGASYTDAPTFSNADVVNFNLTSGVFKMETTATSYTGLQKHLMATFGYAPYNSIKASLKSADEYIQAATYFRMNKAFRNTGNLTIKTLDGDIIVSHDLNLKGNRSLNLFSSHSVVISNLIRIRGALAVNITSNGGGGQ